MPEIKEMAMNKYTQENFNNPMNHIALDRADGKFPIKPRSPATGQYGSPPYRPRETRCTSDPATISR